MPTMKSDDVAVEFKHIVVIVQIETESGRNFAVKAADSSDGA